MSSPAQVLVFWPNLIGYARLLLLAGAVWWMPQWPLGTFALYTVSSLLDAVDGHVARWLNQCSRFGAVLDMVCDRSATTVLLCYLGTVYPDWLWLFQFLIALDLSSHYTHMYSSLLGGSESHKRIQESQHWLMKLYYHNQLVLFGLCAANELYFLLIYLLAFPQQFSALHAQWIQTAAWAVLPFCAMKHVMNFIQLCSATMNLVKLETSGRAGASPAKANGRKRQ